MVIGHYQGIPINGRLVEHDGKMIVELYFEFRPNPDGDGGEPMPVAA